MMKPLFNLIRDKDEYPFDEFLTTAKQLAKDWAEEKLKDSKTVFVDLETTGLLKEGEDLPGIVQLSVVSYRGLALFDTLLNPSQVIPYSSEQIHGISNRDVEECPSLVEVAPLLKKLLEGKNLVAFNASFDVEVLTRNLDKIGYHINYEPECAMLYYSAFNGEWSFKKEGFKWQSLPKLAQGNAHNAVVDCLSTYELLKVMAGNKKDDEELISLEF